MKAISLACVWGERRKKDTIASFTNNETACENTKQETSVDYAKITYVFFTNSATISINCFLKEKVA